VLGGEFIRARAPIWSISSSTHAILIFHLDPKERYENCYGAHDVYLFSVPQSYYLTTLNPCLSRELDLAASTALRTSNHVSVQRLRSDYGYATENLMM